MKKLFAAVAGMIGLIAFAFHNARVIARGMAGKEVSEE